MKNKKDIKTEISSIPIIDQPENVSELINKYGTYEIQPTADTLNDYPAIAQGLAEKEKKSGKIF
ncbi:MAG: hypothetical protein U0M42_04345 [Acutalibacteraceae bacterium]|nr:hypothetical protein [Acutalibacteraceae bacterium]